MIAMNSDKVPRCDRTQIHAQCHLKLPGAADQLLQTLSKSPAWAQEGDAQLEGFTGCSHANTGFSTRGHAEVLLSPRCCSSPSSLPSPTFSGTSLGSTSSQKNLINCFFCCSFAQNRSLLPGLPKRERPLCPAGFMNP